MNTAYNAAVNAITNWCKCWGNETVMKEKLIHYNQLDNIELILV
jgi:hypothetical protein